jgi:hypothetical protein
MTFATSKEPVDAVITWVDGYDPKHQEKLANYLNKMGLQRPVSAEPTRFNQCGEIEHCIKSILRFAPWIRTIYLVTDAQIPSFTASLQNNIPEGKLIIVDHQDIFSGFEHCLPTFNSLSIESVLWRINGLSEKFIYFNDDQFLIRPVHYEDFFREDKLVLRGDWKIQNKKTWRSLLRQYCPFLATTRFLQDKPNEHRRVQESSAAFAGYKKKFLSLPHAPLPLKKSILEDFFFHNPTALVNNIRFPLRDSEQFWAMSLAQHLALKNNQAIIDNSLTAIMVNGACHSLNKIQTRLTYAEKFNQVTFVCMQSMDMAPETTQTILHGWMESRYQLQSIKSSA